MTNTLPLETTITNLTTQPQPETQEPLWKTILSTAKTCPRRGPTLSQGSDQTHLVNLVEALQAQNQAGRISLEETIRNTINISVTPVAQADLEAWENLHAFLAVITKRRLVGLEDLAISALKQALEVPYYKDKEGWAAVLEVYVTVAGIWAIIMGEELYERKKGEDDEHKKDQEGAISKKRWEYWIERLRFVSLWEDLNIGAREVAAEAAAVMHRVV
ncbi:hypothetical protein ASPWEDRAFT_23328 [Aspergillus wentii DTO 134E9]|uniref:Uncharacterized protein n=1 Tax=Aspergillus wentii DTO 134E9 TaxID=1073089 RepID=A0A1L9S235_ASPWE|nr:uncharacterized protein ASPWEDRAFT_23328 [Aspergillus wentii DTO 134E9]KAI9923994.1 hypothetical protein MW887_007452 [Aspergillus wentii]OJJ41221.1 hypothetical protein ASPWEDRAFT_23328 [Aspergillus wentii DTO 134E9]